MEEPTLKVLYVDDEPDLVIVVLRALRLDRTLEVRAVDLGLKAIELIAQAEWLPDVLLLDVMMPDLDGPGTLAQIKKVTSRSIPVIFFTARAQHSEIVELAAAGAIGVLTKPFDPLTLAQDVRRLHAEWKACSQNNEPSLLM